MYIALYCAERAKANREEAGFTWRIFSSPQLAELLSGCGGLNVGKGM